MGRSANIIERPGYKYARLNPGLRLNNPNKTIRWYHEKMRANPPCGLKPSCAYANVNLGPTLFRLTGHNSSPCRSICKCNGRASVAEVVQCPFFAFYKKKHRNVFAQVRVLYFIRVPFFCCLLYAQAKLCFADCMGNLISVDVH